MNKKGFTLVELLVTFAIIALVGGIAVVTISGVLGHSELKVFKNYENSMHAQAIQIMVESLTDPSKASLYPANGGTTRLTLGLLEMEPIKNPRNKDDLCSGSYVDVTRTNVGNVDSFTYVVCLICPNSDYNADGSNCETFEN